MSGTFSPTPLIINNGTGVDTPPLVIQNTPPTEGLWFNSIAKALFYKDPVLDKWVTPPTELRGLRIVGSNTQNTNHAAIRLPDCTAQIVYHRGEFDVGTDVNSTTKYFDCRVLYDGFNNTVYNLNHIYKIDTPGRHSYNADLNEIVPNNIHILTLNTQNQNNGSTANLKGTQSVGLRQIYQYT